MAIMEDNDGDIWFGSEGDGIFILDNQTNRLFRMNPDSFTNISTKGIIKNLYQDKWGYIWIGTEGHGLFKFDKSNRKWYVIQPKTD
ncbi:MAG: hypothetical protein HC906_11970 [Bacteroidales bacterium]|nr:hypothetical protein [Bacteroidales bacterium]